MIFGWKAKQLEEILGSLIRAIYGNTKRIAYLENQFLELATLTSRMAKIIEKQQERIEELDYNS